MKKLLISIIVLAALLVLMNWVYATFFFEKDLMRHSELITLSRKVAEDRDELVYLGESSNKTVGSTEKDRRKTSEMLDDELPEIHCGDITKEAAHAEVYYYLLKNIPDDNDVRIVVVTMNLRSFGANWIYSSLETALQKQLVLLKGYPPLVGRALLAFKAYPIYSKSEWNEKTKHAWENELLEFPYPFPYKTTAEWNRSIARNGVNDAEGNRSQALTELTAHFVKNYAFQIRDDNPRVKDFDRIVKLAEKRGWKLVFNILAENIDKAEELVGSDLTFLMRENVAYLTDRYEGMGVIVVNNLEAVRDKNFIDKDWPTEHYYQEGRQIVAHNVAEALREKSVVVTQPTSATSSRNDQ